MLLLIHYYLGLSMLIISLLKFHNVLALFIESNFICQMISCNMLAKALVMPHFDYCSPVWTNCNTTLLNSLQIPFSINRLARILLSADIRTRIDDMINSLNWIRLNKRWKNQLLVMLFKCPIHKAPPYLSSQFTYTQSIHSHGTRSQSSILNVLYFQLGT